MALDELRRSAGDDKHIDRDRLIGVYIGIVAVFLAICSVGGNNATKTSVQRHIDAANTWAFFQAKNLRRQAIRLQIEDLELMIATNSGFQAEAKDAIFAKIASYREQDAKLTSDIQSGEGLDELFVKAKAYEAERDIALKQDPYFDYAQAFLQIAIVLASVSILIPQRWLPYASGAFAALGALLTINGFTLAVAIPFIS